MNNWTFVDYIIGISIFLVFLLIGLGIPLILLSEYFLRPRKMKSLAKKFSLEYGDNTHFISNSGKRNIITGSIGNHNVEIYDYGAPNYEAIETHFTLYGAPVRSKRFTIISVDGKEETLMGRISGYYPVNKIKQKLLDIQKI